jgi:hypothetical protein
MGKVKETLTEKQERLSITRSAGNFLSEQPSGDLYGAYKELKQAQEDGYGDKLADNYVVVWQPLEHMTVDQIVEVIENSATGSDLEDQPEFIKKMDWKLLRKQKLSLLETIDDMEKRNAEYYKDSIEDLNGILHTIDALQDYAVDELGIDEAEWDDLEIEEKI